MRWPSNILSLKNTKGIVALNAFALLVLYERNPAVTIGSPSQCISMWSFDAFFVPSLHEILNKQSRCHWYQMPQYYQMSQYSHDTTMMLNTGNLLHIIAIWKLLSCKNLIIMTNWDLKLLNMAPGLWGSPTPWCHHGWEETIVCWSRVPYKHSWYVCQAGSRWAHSMGKRLPWNPISLMWSPSIPGMSAKQGQGGHIQPETGSLETISHWCEARQKLDASLAKMLHTSWWNVVVCFLVHVIKNLNEKN